MFKTRKRGYGESDFENTTLLNMIEPDDTLLIPFVSIRKETNKNISIRNIECNEVHQDTIPMELMAELESSRNRQNSIITKVNDNSLQSFKNGTEVTELGELSNDLFTKYFSNNQGNVL